MEKITKAEWVFARASTQVSKGKSILFIGPTEERCLELKNMISFKSVADIIYAGFSKKEIEQLWKKFQKTNKSIEFYKPENFLKTEFYFTIVEDTKRWMRRNKTRNK